MADTKFDLMVEIKSNAKKFQQGMSKATSGIKKLTTNLGAMAKGMIAAFSIKMIGKFIKSISSLYNVQAKAEAKLLTALKGREDVQKRLMIQASVLQGITLFGDEETIAAQAMLASMHLNEAAIKRLTPLVQDLATAKEMKLVAAADLVAKSVGSSTNAMSRYGIEITGAVGSAERLETACDNLSKAFGGQSEAAAKAGTGGIEQLKNALGDIKELMGEVVIETGNVNEAAGDLAETLSGIDWQKTMKPIVTGFKNWSGTVKELAIYLPIVSKFAKAFSAVKAILPGKKAAVEPVTYGTERTGIKAGTLPGIAPLPFQGVAAMTLEDAKATHEIFKEQQELLETQAGYWQEFFNTVTGGHKEAKEAVEMFIPAMEEEANVIDGSEVAIANYLDSIVAMNKQTVEVAGIMTDAIYGIGDAFAQMARDGKMSLSSLVKVLIDVTTAVIQMYLAQSMAAAIASAMTPNPADFIFPGNVILKLGIASAAVGALGIMFKSLIPDFASGAIVSGETIARVGEYPGAKSNPEVIAPLSKLKDMLGTGSDEVVFIIKGDVLEGVRRNYYQRRQLMR